MRQNNYKIIKIVAFLIAIVILITSLPISIFANTGTGGGTGTDHDGDYGSGIGVPNTTTDYVTAYTVSLVDVEYRNELLVSEKVIGSMILKGKYDQFYTPIENTGIYAVYDINTGYRPATKLDFLSGEDIEITKATNLPIASLSQSQFKQLTIKPNNAEEVVKFFTGGKGNDEIFTEMPKEFKIMINYLTGVFVDKGQIMPDGNNVPSNMYTPSRIEDLVGQGRIAMHVEAMMQEVKPTPLTYTSAGYARYATKEGVNRSYYSRTPRIGEIFLAVSHLKSHQSGTSLTSLSNRVKGYDTFSKIADRKNTTMLTNAAGIYIIKLIPTNNSTKHPTEINIPPTDFHMTTLKPVPNEDGLLIDLEKGEITLDVRGGYNGDTRGYGEGGNTNVDEDGNNGNLAGADNSTITYKGYPWKETDGSLMDKKNSILFAKALSNNAQSTKISCPIHGANAIPIEDDRLESEFGIPGLARVFNYSVFPNNRLEQEWVENPKGIVADDGCRIFPELQEHLHNKTIETIESNPDTSALLTSKVREALKINGLKLNWDERNISKDFLANDDRIKFQVYLQTDYQKLQGKGEGIVSYNEHITETMDKNNVNSLPGNKSLKLKVQNNDDGTLTLKWDPNDPKIKEALDYSKSIFVTASINWIEPEDRQTHAYEGDKWLRTESINSNNIQGGNGWINNSLQFELRIPRPNLKANEVTPRYDEEREMICIEGVGFIDKLMPGQKTISSDHTIRLYDANGKLVGEQTKQFKDAQLGTQVDFEEICFKVPKPKPSEEVDYVVEYEINPSETKPKAEETFEDNIVVNEITIGGDFNWKATNVTASAVNTTPSGIEEFVYKLDVVGQGILEKNSLPNTPTYKTDHIIRYWDKENPGSVQEFPLNPTKDVSRGQSIEYSQLQYPDNWLQPEITVPRHTTKEIVIEYEVNPSQTKPDFETTYNDNVVRTEIKLPGPTYIDPPNKNIPVHSLDCVYPNDNGTDTKVSSVNTFTFSMPYTEKWGKKNPTYHHTGIIRYPSHEALIDNVGASVIPQTMPGYSNARPDGIPDDNQQAPYDVTYSFYEYSGNTMIPNMHTEIIPTYRREERTHYHTHDGPTGPPASCSRIPASAGAHSIDHYCPGHGTEEDPEPCPENDHCACVARYCTEYHIYEIDSTLRTDYYVAFDDEYTNDKNNSRTFSTEASGTPNDKIFTSGKGIQSVVRAKMISDWPYNIEVDGHFAYSVASGPNAHNKPKNNASGAAAWLDPDYKPTTPTFDVTSSKVEPNQDYIISDGRTPWENTNHLRRYVFQLKENPLSKNGTREAYTNLNYPEAVKLGNGSIKGLETNSIFYITAFGNNGNGHSPVLSKSGNGAGICYKDNLIPISNYYNDYWSNRTDKRG